MSYDLVIPTAGRPSLGRLLDGLADGHGPWPERVIVVDDRGPGAGPLALGDPPFDLADPPPELAERVEVLTGPARGPAAARNAGWRRARAAWVAFLDDDVVPPPGWRAALAADLEEPADDVAGSEGRIVVPLPRDRRPTDWERNTAGLETARWATADLAYRRRALEAVGGFDERFGRAYREDADLGLRLTEAGWAIVRGRRSVLHPVRPSDRSVSLRMQRGNADDVLMRALHGRDWRERAGAPRGRLPRHLAVTAAGLATLATAATGRRRAAAASGALWLAGTAELTWARIAPGPRGREEVATMLLTSAALPPVAAWHWARGHARRRHALAAPGPQPAAAPRAPGPQPAAAPPAAVLLDRDGTLVEDVPYNADPTLVRPMPGAREALDRLRRAGVRLAVVSNQSGVGRGLIAMEDVRAVNRRVEELLGPLGPWAVCPHAPDAGCDCRKPLAGLVLEAAERLGVSPERCAVVGDIGADVEAARAAGARAVLVPTPRTRPEEVAAAPELAATLPDAVELLLGDVR